MEINDIFLERMKEILGADYDAFKESTNNYDPAICAYRDTIQAFGTHFENVSQLTETLVTDLTDIIEHMTGV